MAKRPSLIGSLSLDAGSTPQPEAKTEVKKPAGRKPRPNIVHTSVYLPRPVYMKIREIAYVTDQKIHDLLIEGIDNVLRNHGHPGVDALKEQMQQEHLA